jgi:hypothetical protein
LQWKFGSRNVEAYFYRESFTSKVYGVVRVLVVGDEESYTIFDKTTVMGLDDAVYTMLAATLHEQLVETEQWMMRNGVESDDNESDGDESTDSGDDSNDDEQKKSQRIAIDRVLEQLEQAVAKTEEKLQANYKQSVVDIQRLLALGTQLELLPDYASALIGRRFRPRCAEMRWSIGKCHIILQWYIYGAKVCWKITAERTNGGLYHDETVETCDQSFEQAIDQPTTTVLPAVIECLQTQIKTAQSA